MSVILTACKHSKQKAIEKALKQKAEQKRAKREAKLEAMTSQMGHIPPQSASTRVWTFLMEDRPYSIVFDSNKMEVTCNGEIAETVNEFTDNGAVLLFQIGGHQGQIIGVPRAHKGLDHVLTIDGNQVPE